MTNDIAGGIVYRDNPEDIKGNWGRTVIANLGNIFAKKINLGDNCSRFDEFLNKYRDFVYGMENLGAKLMPTEKVRFFKRIFLLENARAFLKRC